MITPDQIERIKKHLDYPQTTLGLDINSNRYPSYIPIDYDIDGICNNMSVEQERSVLDVLTKLDGLWEKIYDSLCILSAKKVGEIEVNENYYDLLNKAYDAYRDKLIGMLDHRLAFRNYQKNTHNGKRCK